MSRPALEDLAACFEGVIPSIVATASAQGLPNISYLSHVVRLDADHVALSNQFFSKTARNIAENPRATLLLVDASDGTQHRLGLCFVESRESGPDFDHVALQLRASSAQIGMADVMRLKAIDVYRVETIDTLPHPTAPEGPSPAPRRLLAHAAALATRLAELSDLESLVDCALQDLTTGFGYEGVQLLMAEAGSGRLTLLGSRGYASSGIGSELPPGEGIAGSAAAGACIVKVSDMSRVQRFAGAIRREAPAAREIPLPDFPAAMSQIGVPLVVQGRVLGVILAESRRRYAFTAEDESALTLAARQLAASLRLAEHAAGEAGEPAAPAPPPHLAGECHVVHHAWDDSVFIDNDYVIKGVAGRLLAWLLERHLRDGRTEFTNRELRLAPDLRLPEIKDNLETRLLLLRRRLAERELPVRLEAAGRGRVRLLLARTPRLERTGP
jgi:adenylate cyclase